MCVLSVDRFLFVMVVWGAQRTTSKSLLPSTNVGPRNQSKAVRLGNSSSTC